MAAASAAASAAAEATAPVAESATGACGGGGASLYRVFLSNTKINSPFCHSDCSGAEVASMAAAACDAVGGHHCE